MAAVQSCEPMLVIFYLHNNGFFFPALLLKEAASEGFFCNESLTRATATTCLVERGNGTQKEIGHATLKLS